MQPMAPGLVIAAPSSGSGKTLVTLALLRALSKGGIKVSSAKVGPDYIDPAFHEAASGRDCFNIDPWAMRGDVQFELKNRISSQADLVICEGVMGLFDGAKDGTGATADLAEKFKWPVIMVVDVRGQATSAIASLKGFAEFRPDVNIAGVIFNKVGSSGHQTMLDRAMATFLPDIKVIGYLPRNDALIMPERHLGLVQARENKDLEGFLDRAADWVSDNLDFSLLQSLAETGENLANTNVKTISPFGQRIAVAKDDAFAFCYTSLLAEWRRAGSEISLFSPLAGEAPLKTADAVYLPGGYPELYAGLLSANKIFMDGLVSAAARGTFIFGECGGYMTLGESLIDAKGQAHQMAGLLPVQTSFENPKLHLGYRQIELLVDCPLGSRGTKFKGHEFHYASITDECIDGRLFSQCDATGLDQQKAGHMKANVCGSYLHLIDHAND